MRQRAWGRAHEAESKAHSVKNKDWKADHMTANVWEQAPMPKFRFQDLKIWQQAIEIADELFDIADELEQKKLYRFAEQLRGAGLSMSNNIAEGSGSSSKKEFIQFLNIAKRSTFENANMLIVLNRRSLLEGEKLSRLLDKLDHLCRQISSFQRSLTKIN